MNFYDDQSTTTRQLFDRFFPERDDVVRLLMEPIVYANGSTLEDPAITYGIVFSNFMSKGVYTFQGGTDQLVLSMQQELRKQRRRRPHPVSRAADRRGTRSRQRRAGTRPLCCGRGSRLQRQSEGHRAAVGR